MALIQCALFNYISMHDMHPSNSFPRWMDGPEEYSRLLGRIHDAEINWSLLWADEFEGSALDASSWTPLEGDGKR